MSAKKKRRKIVVNSALAKVGECGPNCKKTQMANKLLAEDDKREKFLTRLQAPSLIQIETTILPELGEEIAIDVFVHGGCHALSFECMFFENQKIVVIEGSSEATSSKQALVELLSFFEDELEFESSMMAIPKKRSDIRSTVRNLCQFLDFELIPAAAGWSEEFLYLIMEF